MITGPMNNFCHLWTMLRETHILTLRMTLRVWDLIIRLVVDLKEFSSSRKGTVSFLSSLKPFIDFNFNRWSSFEVTNACFIILTGRENLGYPLSSVAGKEMIREREDKAENSSMFDAYNGNEEFASHVYEGRKMFLRWPRTLWLYIRILIRTFVENRGTRNRWISDYRRCNTWRKSSWLWVSSQRNHSLYVPGRILENLLVVRVFENKLRTT